MTPAELQNVLVTGDKVKITHESELEAKKYNASVRMQHQRTKGILEAMDFPSCLSITKGMEIEEGVIYIYALIRERRSQQRFLNVEIISDESAEDAND